ncbi:hypothetical protein XFF6166_1060036 [Xanthomonas citri pv. fuscans]|nr:hypothetical protein XFF6166_1060036 [Xanthomonas citri pv. fuscans]SON98308.1 hypothetical protein XFF7767_1020008 [Xanthomonas citri pv. fuscans]SOO04076.1 hypothetical protein XFF6960_930006 [Xanthomonas citri pv. fuscans]SOO11530.1 hypothetical protein XFF6970_890035 [Xanthomonas citri pv. fuscans]SOO16071.1 hypothetical protein XFF7766_730022 [Xanthomonas citri pv. fuscans]
MRCDAGESACAWLLRSERRGRIASRQALPHWRRQMESGALSAATNLDYFPGAGGPDQARR